MPDSAYSVQYGDYEYDKIVDAIKAKGYTVYSERREKNTDPNYYSWHVAKQVDSLKKAGVKSGNITVVGSGKGALIAMLASGHIRDGLVRYVILSNCNEAISEYFHIDMYGTVLSVYEESDYVWQSCKHIIDESKGVYKYKEVALHTGLRNGYLYKPLPEWLDLVYNWIEM